MQLSGVVPIGKAGGWTYQDELVVFSYAAETIRSAVAADVVEGNCGHERRMALASCDHSLLPRRINGDKVVLTTGLGTGMVNPTIDGNE